MMPSCLGGIFPTNHSQIPVVQNITSCISIYVNDVLINYYDDRVLVRTIHSERMVYH